MLNSSLKNSEKSKNNPFEEGRRNIFGKIYLANVHNRLRELENPNDVDCKRWVWELVQNAKDSISGSSDRTSVDIEIIVVGNTYTFRHNGSPFTNDNLTALLYKYSDGKTNDCESTGRFGTGFLTTHSLSKKVKISGDVISRGETEPQGFTITMYREGEDEELLRGLKRTEESYVSPIETDGWTTYVYEAVTKRNKEAGELGIKNFKENIAQVMLFCPEISSIKLINNGKEYNIERGEVTENLLGGCEMLFLYITDNQRSYTKRFLYKKIDEYNESLTEKFGTKRNLRICCAIQLDEKNDIFVVPSSPCLFCTLPLVGSEEHILPFIINSPDFEPDSERQSILLDRNEINERTQMISDPGINKMILKKAQEMYNSLLMYICHNSVGKRYELTRGLCSIPDVTRFFDKIWYEKEFIKPMRNILLEYPTVWNGDHYIKLTDVFLPKVYIYHNEDTTKDFTRHAYNLISKLYQGNVPEYDESIIIEKNIWKKDSRLTYIGIKECVDKVEKCANMEELSLIINDPWEWLDDFLVFIKNYHPKYLSFNAIIPNMNSTFVKLTKDLASSNNVPEDMIECIEEIGISWKDEHIHKKIVKFTSGSDHDIDFAVSKMRNCLKDWSERILTLMHYIPDDQDQEFKQKREEIYEFCSTVWDSQKKKIKRVNDFPKELWNGIDDMVFEHLIEEISKYGKLDDNSYTIDFMIKFLKCVSIYYPKYRNFKLIPNQNGMFCKINDIYEDNSIPLIFKECLKTCFDYDIKNELLDPRMLPIKDLLQKEKKSIYNYNEKLKYYFELPESYDFNSNNGTNANKEYVKVEKKERAAMYLIRIIPEQNPNYEQYSSDNEEDSSRGKQRRLFHLYQIFVKTDDKAIEIKDNDQNEGIWKYSNRYIYKIIRNVIEEHADIDSLANSLEISKEETLNHLKEFIINYSKDGRIVPNQNDHFCQLDELKNDESLKNNFIPEKLKDISQSLDHDIRNNLVHQFIGRPCSEAMTYIESCLEIDKLVKEKYENPVNHGLSQFKEAARSLIEEYFYEIGDKKAEEQFPSTYNLKDRITLNVIFDKELRQNMTKLGKAYGSDAIIKALNNPNIMDELMKGELSDEKYATIKQYNSFNEKYGKDAITTLMKYPNTLKKILNGEISDDEYLSIIHYDHLGNPLFIVEHNGYRKIRIPFDSSICSFEDILGFLNEYISYIFDFRGKMKREINIYGEIYVYEYLRNSGLYKNVTWNRLSQEDKGEVIEYNDKKYWIEPDVSYSNIIVETNDNHTVYVEVISTSNKFNNNVPLFFNEKKIQEMKEIHSHDQYVLAIVFGVKSNPIHFFMTLRDNLSYKVIQ